MLSNDTIDAIYQLREAVETKVHAEAALDAAPSENTRAAFLDATLDVESKTLKAIEVCHDCGHKHEPHHVYDNVINVDFRPEPAS